MSWWGIGSDTCLLLAAQIVVTMVKDRLGKDDAQTKGWLLDGCEYIYLSTPFTYRAFELGRSFLF